MMEALHRYDSDYQHGAAAPKTVPRTREGARRTRRPAEKTYRKVQVLYKMHPKMLAKRQNALRICSTVALVFLMMVGVVACNAVSAKINLENISIQKNIDSLEARIDKLNLAISTKCDIQQVAKVAEQELSMGFPEDSQVYYMEFEKEPEPQPQEESKGFFQRIQEWIQGIVG